MITFTSPLRESRLRLLCSLIVSSIVFSNVLAGFAYAAVDSPLTDSALDGRLRAALKDIVKYVERFELDCSATLPKGVYVYDKSKPNEVWLKTDHDTRLNLTCTFSSKDNLIEQVEVELKTIDDSKIYLGSGRSPFTGISKLKLTNEAVDLKTSLASSLNTWMSSLADSQPAGNELVNPASWRQIKIRRLNATLRSDAARYLNCSSIKFPGGVSISLKDVDVSSTLDVQGVCEASLSSLILDGKKVCDSATLAAKFRTSHAGVNWNLAISAAAVDTAIFNALNLELTSSQGALRTSRFEVAKGEVTFKLLLDGASSKMEECAGDLTTALYNLAVNPGDDNQLALSSIGAISKLTIPFKFTISSLQTYSIETTSAIQTGSFLALLKDSTSKTLSFTITKILAMPMRLEGVSGKRLRVHLGSKTSVDIAPAGAKSSSLPLCLTKSANIALEKSTVIDFNEGLILCPEFKTRAEIGEMRVRVGEDILILNGLSGNATGSVNANRAFEVHTELKVKHLELETRKAPEKKHPVTISCDLSTTLHGQPSISLSLSKCSVVLPSEHINQAIYTALALMPEDNSPLKENEKGKIQKVIGARAGDYAHNQVTLYANCRALAMVPKKLIFGEEAKQLWVKLQGRVKFALVNDNDGDRAIRLFDSKLLHMRDPKHSDNKTPFVLKIAKVLALLTKPFHSFFTKDLKVADLVKTEDNGLQSFDLSHLLLERDRLELGFSARVKMQNSQQ